MSDNSKVLAQCVDIAGLRGSNSRGLGCGDAGDRRNARRNSA